MQEILETERIVTMRTGTAFRVLSRLLSKELRELNNTSVVQNSVCIDTMVETISRTLEEYVYSTELAASPSFNFHIH
jgi:hypothetical protein